MNLPGGYKYSVFSQPSSGRMVVVRDRKGKVVGQRDPYPEGMPVLGFRRKQLEREAAMKIIEGRE